MNEVMKTFRVSFAQEKQIAEDIAEANKILNPTAKFALKVADIETLAGLLTDEDKTRIVADYFKLIGVKEPE